MNDLGMNIVNAIFTALMIDEQWSIQNERGFTWWGKDFAQHVWAEQPFSDDEFQITRLHARTDMLRAVQASANNHAYLNATNVHASMSGLCF